LIDFNWIFWVLVGVFVLGALIAFVARGWRKVDDHPYCRACGFDLMGRVPAPSSCPQCGAALSEPKSIRIGQNEPSRALQFLGLLLMVPLLGFVGLLVASWNGVNLEQYVPTPMLVSQLSSDNFDTYQTAFKEVTRRKHENKLTDENYRSLVQAALKEQKRGSDRYHLLMAFVSDAQEKDLLTPELRTTLVKQSSEPDLRLAMSTREDILAFSIGTQLDRAPNFIQQQARIRKVLFNGQEVPMEWTGTPEQSLRDGGDFAVLLPTGMTAVGQEVQAEIEVTTFDEASPESKEVRTVVLRGEGSRNFSGMPERIHRTRDSLPNATPVGEKARGIWLSELFPRPAATTRATTRPATRPRGPAQNIN
jgi:predicted RNA-binding Zn-ribbon protein involved in translation (DUF1610 family)